MGRYYLCYFDGDEINRFWGTEVHYLNGVNVEVCAKPYLVFVDDELIESVGATYDDIDLYFMQKILNACHGPVSMDSDVDLENCVYPDTVECLVGFVEVDADDVQ